VVEQVADTVAGQGRDHEGGVERAAAQAVDGVASLEITVFQREGQDDVKPLQDGFLPMDRLEIARCDNDPNFAEHGVFVLSVGGGK